MKPDVVNPPAAIRSADSLIEITSRCVQLRQGISRNARVNLEYAIELGGLLIRAKELAKVGEFTPFVEKVGLSHQRASEFMRIALLPDADIFGCESIADARKLIKEQLGTVLPPVAVPDNSSPQSDPPPKPRPEGDEQNEPGEDWDEEDQDDPIHMPEPETVKVCVECARRGRRVNCPECAELNRPKRARKKIGRHQDVGGSRGPKNGEELFSWKMVEQPYGELVRAVDKLGKRFNCKNTPDAEAIFRLLEETYNNFQAWYKRAVKQNVQN